MYRYTVQYVPKGGIMLYRNFEESANAIQSMFFSCTGIVFRYKLSESSLDITLVSHPCFLLLAQCSVVFPHADHSDHGE